MLAKVHARRSATETWRYGGVPCTMTCVWMRIFQIRFTVHVGMSECHAPTTGPRLLPRFERKYSPCEATIVPEVCTDATCQHRRLRPHPPHSIFSSDSRVWPGACQRRVSSPPLSRLSRRASLTTSTPDRRGPRGRGAAAGCTCSRARLWTLCSLQLHGMRKQSRSSSAARLRNPYPRA